MRIETGIWKTFAAALAVAICCSAGPADARSKGGSRSGGSSFARRSSAALVRKPIAPRLPRKIERPPRVGGIQAQRGSSLRGSAVRDSSARARTRASELRAERATPKLETGRLKNVRTRVEGIRSEGVRNAEAASRLRLQPGLRGSRTEQVANGGDEAVKAGIAAGSATSGLLTTVGAAQGAALAKIATGSVGTLVGGGALAGELAVAGGAVTGAAAGGAALGYAVHKGYEAVAGETIGDTVYEAVDDTPSDAETEAEAEAGREAGRARKEEREAEQNGQTPADAGDEGEGQSQGSPASDDSGTPSNGEGEPEDGGEGSEESDPNSSGGCDPAEQSCNQGGDDGGGDENAADDGQSGADGASTPNPDAADRNSVPLYDRVGGRLGRDEKSRQEDGLDVRRGGGHTDPTEEGGSGRFVGDSGRFVRGQKSREQKLVEQGIDAGSGGHAGAGKERKRAIQPGVQELEDLAVRAGGDVTNPQQGSEGSSGGGGIAPGAPAYGARTGTAGSAVSASGRLSRAVESGRVRIDANVR